MFSIQKVSFIQNEVFSVGNQISQNGFRRIFRVQDVHQKQTTNFHVSIDLWEMTAVIDWGIEIPHLVGITRSVFISCRLLKRTSKQHRLNQVCQKVLYAPTNECTMCAPNRYNVTGKNGFLKLIQLPLCKGIAQFLLLQWVGFRTAAGSYFLEFFLAQL